MYTKKIYSTSLNNIININGGESYLPLKKSIKVIGVQLNDIDITDDVYVKIAELETPYIPIVKVSEKTIDTSLLYGSVELADTIMPLLMNYQQYQYLFNKVLLLKIPENRFENISRWHELLVGRLKQFGIRNITVSYTIKNMDEMAPATFEEIQKTSVPDSYPVHWNVVYVEDNNKLSDLVLQNNPDPGKFTIEDQLLSLHEENVSLKGTNETLLKNIHDLNNYYRYVRGETTFKYNNREDEEKKSETIVAAISNQRMGIDELKKFYYQAYDRLPSWYKRVGTLLKIILWRRELWFYVNKKHKQAFLDLVYSLPDERQLRTWYYYEYEILPGWYKRLGKML